MPPFDNATPTTENASAQAALSAFLEAAANPYVFGAIGSRQTIDGRIRADVAGNQLDAAEADHIQRELGIFVQQNPKAVTFSVRAYDPELEKVQPISPIAPIAEIFSTSIQKEVAISSSDGSGQRKTIICIAGSEDPERTSQLHVILNLANHLQLLAQHLQVPGMSELVQKTAGAIRALASGLQILVREALKNPDKIKAEAIKQHMENIGKQFAELGKQGVLPPGLIQALMKQIEVMRGLSVLNPAANALKADRAMPASLAAFLNNGRQITLSRAAAPAGKAILMPGARIGGGIYDGLVSSRIGAAPGFASRASASAAGATASTLGQTANAANTNTAGQSFTGLNSGVSHDTAASVSSISASTVTSSATADSAASIAHATNTQQTAPASAPQATAAVTAGAVAQDAAPPSVAPSVAAPVATTNAPDASPPADARANTNAAPPVAADKANLPNTAPVEVKPATPEAQLKVETLAKSDDVKPALPAETKLMATEILAKGEDAKSAPPGNSQGQPLDTKAVQDSKTGQPQDGTQETGNNNAAPVEVATKDAGSAPSQNSPTVNSTPADPVSAASSTTASIASASAGAASSENASPLSTLQIVNLGSGNGLSPDGTPLLNLNNPAHQEMAREISEDPIASIKEPVATAKSGTSSEDSESGRTTVSETSASTQTSTASTSEPTRPDAHTATGTAATESPIGSPDNANDRGGIHVSTASLDPRNANTDINSTSASEESKLGAGLNDKTKKDFAGNAEQSCMNGGPCTGGCPGCVRGGMAKTASAGNSGMGRAGAAMSYDL